MKAKNVEIIFWRPGDQPIGLHAGCEAKYEGYIENPDHG